jgi:hypothetical protein
LTDGLLVVGLSRTAIDALSADADDLRDPDEEPEPIGEE